MFRLFVQIENNAKNASTVTFVAITFSRLEWKYVCSKMI